MYENEKKEIIKTALQLMKYNLISLTGGNVTLRNKKGHVMVTPSGIPYETMLPEDIVVTNEEGDVIEGTRKASVDIEAALYILKNIPEVNAVIHTHQVYATAVGLIGDVLPAAVTTLPNACMGAVDVAPYHESASLGMGIKAVEYLNGKRAVILKHHGVIAVGKNLKEALYAAVYLEDSAKAYIVAKSITEPAILNEEQVKVAVEKFTPDNYGQ
jgi:L-ribulose-5-phosphate 4-epimerase